MSFDLSRLLYPHWVCQTLPCICIRKHNPLLIALFECKQCGFVYYTHNELHNHQFETHTFNGEINGK